MNRRQPVPRPATVTGAVVELRGVSVRFPRRAEPALRKVSLRLAPGEGVIVLGASGSGKSTVLHVVTGEVPHTISATMSGRVVLGGTTTERTRVVERSRHLGVLAQDPGTALCLPEVEAELALPLENQGTDPADIGPRIGAALEAVGAGAHRQRATAKLSGGESQRVALAAALVAEPEVLLLDEPTSMLDTAGIESLRSALAAAVGQYGPAVVLIEHRLDEWAGGLGIGGLPARALALSPDGDVLADGPTAVVLRDHAVELQAAGCWLPLDAELLALTGTDGGLEAPENTELLASFAAGAPSTTGTPEGDRSPPVLTGRGLVVGRRSPTARRSRRRRHVDVRTETPPLLSGVDLAVRPGEIVALLGANGAGKTTLLLTLARLLDPLSGQVEGVRPGLVFQNPEHQFLGHTVADEIAHGLAPAVAAKILPRQLRRHRLEHLAAQNPFQLSGGEKRRLSLAAMLAHSRPVLLADEPTLGLDRRDTIATSATLRDAAGEGTAVVLASHDLRTVVALADRVVVLGEGGIVADGPTVEVLRDSEVCTRAGLTLPPLVAWLFERVPGHAVAHVLRELDDAVGAAEPLKSAR